MKKAIIPSKIETVSNISEENIFEKAVLIKDEKILAICSPQDIPSDFTLERCRGVLTPGIIEPHCHLGVHETGQSGQNDTNEMIDPVTPHLRAEDALNPADPSFKTALAAGVTTLCILPGSANIFGGSGVIVNPVGQSLNQMLVKADTGLKCAFGENPKNVYSAKPQGPNTRMGIAGLFRIWMTRALEYAGKAAMHSQPALPNKKNEQDFNQNNSFSRDLKLEVLAQVLSGERLLRIHVHRADDIMTVLRLCDEFNIKPCLEHATQAGVVADELLKRGTLIAYGPVLSPPKKQENDLRDIKTAADLIKKGALLALTTDHPVTSVSTLQICAAMLMRHNVSRELALASITRNAAALCGLQSEIGTLEPGKRADMVLWSGDPLDARNIPIEVYIKGEKVLT